MSAGQFHYTTDGFRKNFDIQHDIQTLFAQAAVTQNSTFRANSAGDERKKVTFGSTSIPVGPIRIGSAILIKIMAGLASDSPSVSRFGLHYLVNL